MSYPCRIHERAREEYMEAYLWYELEILGLGDKDNFFFADGILPQ